MNIYEEAKLETKLEKITSQIGYLVLDLILVGLKKVNTENEIYKDFVEAKLEAYADTDPGPVKSGSNEKAGYRTNCAK